MNIEDKAYFAVSPAETEKKIRNLTAAWRKLMNVADNLHGMANPSPEIMKRQDQVDADMERIGNQIAELKKSIGVQENVSVRLAKPVEDKAYFDGGYFRTAATPLSLFTKDLRETLRRLAAFSECPILGYGKLTTQSEFSNKINQLKTWITADIAKIEKDKLKEKESSNWIRAMDRWIEKRKEVIAELKKIEDTKISLLPTVAKNAMPIEDKAYFDRRIYHSTGTFQTKLDKETRVPIDGTSKFVTVDPAQYITPRRVRISGIKGEIEIAAQLSGDEIKGISAKSVKAKAARKGTKAKFANFKVGQIVKYKNPNSDEDPNQKYIIKEVNGDRGFMETHGGYFKDATFPPRMLYQQNEIMLASRTGIKSKFEHNLTYQIALQESNNPPQIYKITREIWKRIRSRKELGYFNSREIIEKALATGEAVKMSRTGFKARFAATRIWPNDYNEILNANAKYARLIFDRQKIIRANAGRRIKGEQPLEVPAPPIAPEFPFAFADGDYVGLVLGGQSNVPKGSTVKWANNANSIKMSRTGTKSKFASDTNYAHKNSIKIKGKTDKIYALIYAEEGYGDNLTGLWNGHVQNNTNPKVNDMVTIGQFKTKEAAKAAAIKALRQEEQGTNFSKSKFAQMQLLGTILPTADSIAANNSYAKQVEQMKLQVANKELKGLDKRVVGNETRYYKTLNNYAIVSQSGKILWFVVKSDGDYKQKLSRTGTKSKFANRGAFAEASSSPVLGSLLEKKVMPEGGWRAVETDGGALVIAFEDGDIAGNFARRAAENGYSATAPMAMAGRFWNVKVQNENKN